MNAQTSTIKPSISTGSTHRVAVLAIDGLDWQLLQQLVDSGNMPFCKQLLEAGSSTTVTVPPPHSAAATWSTIATGVMADQHGVCFDFSVRPDGLTVQQVASNEVKSPPFWQTAMDAGLVTCLAGWPATFPAQLSAKATPGCRVVSQGFEIAEYDHAQCWPLSPEAVAPLSERSTVLDARFHPTDLQADMVSPLLSQACRAAGSELTLVAGRQLAQLASVHNLGVHWAQQTDWQLLGLRFNVLPAWQSALNKHAIDSVEGLSPWYNYLDMMIGRYMGIIGQTAHLLIVSDHGLAPQQSTIVEQLFGVRSKGCLLAAGPGVPVDELLDPISGLDICPTILALLGLDRPEDLSGRNFLHANNNSHKQQPSPVKALQGISIDALISEAPIDQQAQDWLNQQGFPAVDLTPLKSMVRRVTAENLAGWASAKQAKGNKEQAIIALEHALELAPQHVYLRLTLGQYLLEAGRIDDCNVLTENMPETLKEAFWPDLTASFIAIASKNWTVAEHHLNLLGASEQAPINSAQWLARIKVEQQDWAAAEQLFASALQGLGNQAANWEGLGFAQLRLGKSTEAIESLSQAIAHEPTNALYHQSRALAYESEGKITEAQGDLWRALALNNELVSARRHLGRLAAS